MKALDETSRSGLEAISRAIAEAAQVQKQALEAALREIVTQQDKRFVWLAEQFAATRQQPPIVV